MEPKGYHPKLTAIQGADVAGYSRLMQDDEAATLGTIESYKQLFSDLIKQRRGRLPAKPSSAVEYMALLSMVWQSEPPFLRYDLLYTCLPTCS